MFVTMGRLLCQNYSKNINIPIRYSLAKLNMCLLRIIYFYDRVNRKEHLCDYIHLFGENSIMIYYSLPFPMWLYSSYCIVLNTTQYNS